MFTALPYNKNYQWYVILIVAILLLFSGISLTSIYPLDEAKNAEAAREMLLHNDFITPTFNGELRTDKPPLHYYFMMISYQLFGVNAFSARFFSALMGVATILITYFFAKRHLGRKVAFFSAFVLLSSVHFLLQMQMAVPDPYLIFFLTVAFFSFYEHFQHHKKTLWWIFYLSIGLGVLTKGPIAIALPGFTALLYLIVSKSLTWKTIVRLNPFLGLLVSLLVALPWYFLVHKATDGAFTNGFFIEHNIERFSTAKESHDGSFLLTLAFVLLGFLPYVFFIPNAIKQTIKKWNEVHTYLLTGSVVVILFFMLSGTKLPNYTVPCYPLLAIIISSYFVHQQTKQWQWIATVVFCLLLPIGAYVGLQQDHNLQHLSSYALCFIIPCIGAISTFFTKQKLLMYMSSWLLFGWVAFVFIYPQIDAQNPVLQTKDLFTEKKQVIAYKRFNPAYVFQLQRQIHVLNTEEELADFLQANSDLILISREDYWEELNQFPLKKIAAVRDTFETPTTVVAILETKSE